MKKRFFLIALTAILAAIPSTHNSWADEIKPGTLEMTKQTAIGQTMEKKQVLQIADFHSNPDTTSALIAMIDAKKAANGWLSVMDPSQVVSHSSTMVVDKYGKVTAIISIMYKTDAVVKSPIAP